LFEKYVAQRRFQSGVYQFVLTKGAEQGVAADARNKLGIAGDDARLRAAQ